MRRAASILSALALLIAFAARASSDPVRFTVLSSTDEPFRSAFNRDRADVRVVELVSPTCPFCLEGVSKIQSDLFAKEASKKLVGFAIWVPMLGGKAGNVPEAAALAPDPRVSHYWDQSNDLGIAFERLLPVASGPAWDVYLLYAPGITWSGSDPPKPSFWMHQLPISNAPRLDAAEFADQARGLLDNAPRSTGSRSN